MADGDAEQLELMPDETTVEGAGDGKGEPDPRDVALGEAIARAQAAETRAEKVEQRLDEIQRGGGSDAPKTYTRAELQAAVDAGHISDEQMQAQLDTQRDRELEERVTKRVTTQVRTEDRTRALNEQLAAYKAAHPDIATPGTDDRNRLQTEYTYLVSELGMEPGLPTEIAACRNVFGDARPARERTRAVRETHVETGGGGGRSRQRGGGSEGGVFDGIPPKIENHYRDMVDKGYYGSEGLKNPLLQRHMDIARDRQERLAKRADRQAVH